MLRMGNLLLQSVSRFKKQSQSGRDNPEKSLTLSVEKVGMVGPNPHIEYSYLMRLRVEEPTYSSS